MVLTRLINQAVKVDTTCMIDLPQSIEAHPVTSSISDATSEIDLAQAARNYRRI